MEKAAAASEATGVVQEAVSPAAETQIARKSEATATTETRLEKGAVVETSPAQIAEEQIETASATVKTAASEEQTQQTELSAEKAVAEVESVTATLETETSAARSSSVLPAPIWRPR